MDDFDSVNRSHKDFYGLTGEGSPTLEENGDAFEPNLDSDYDGGWFDSVWQSFLLGTNPVVLGCVVLLVMILLAVGGGFFLWE